jgi:sugar transferase (PEP-CTERM/EpsH1 system associated)
MMSDVLFLAHRIPYPPDKGDKIRSWHMLAHLAKRHTVHLGCFVDDMEDLKHLPLLEDLCGSVQALPLKPTHAKLRALPALFRGRALSVDYYRDGRMAAWIDWTLRTHAMAGTLLFSSPMAQYILPHLKSAGRVVMDFVDVDSDKWRQYAAAKPWPLSWLYGREYRRLLAFERQVAAAVDTSVFVSPKEAELFRTLAPESAARVTYLNNGVDAGYFSPEARYDNPFMAGEAAIVFTGAMDYWANVDAVEWFAKEVFPAVLATAPQAQFVIVGGRPTPAVQALASLPRVTVTGRVPDVRPYLAHAAAVVCPLRIARGIQNKVLEGMAMAKPVVATPGAFEGIDATPGVHVLVADGAEAFAAQVLAVLQGKVPNTFGAAARQVVLERYSWDLSLKQLGQLLGLTEAVS